MCYIIFLSDLSKKLSNLVRFFLVKTVNYVLLLSKTDENRLKKYNQKIEYHFIKNGISSINESKEIQKENTIIFGGGIGMSTKGLKFLESALDNLNHKLIIFGPNVHQSQHTSYYGEVDRKTFHSFILKARIVIIPSEYEPFSMIALESLSLGVPIIISKNCGIAQYLTDEFDCLLVEFANIRELSQKIDRLFSDDDLWLRLSRNGLETAKKFLWQNIIHEYIELYEKSAIRS